jgi:hypothetical protein
VNSLKCRGEKRKKPKVAGGKKAKGRKKGEKPNVRYRYGGIRS